MVWLFLAAWVGLSLSPGAAAGAQADPLPWASATSKRAPGASRWERELDRRVAEIQARRGRSPDAVLPLLGLLSQLQGEVAPPRLEAFVREVAENHRRHPLVRSYARHQLARLLEARGDRAAAQEHLRSEGYLLSWQILGPFDNANRRGETAVYPPQTEPYDPDQTFTGKLPSELLSWRALDYDAIPRAGYVSFDDLLRPNREATGYATCWVHVDEATPAALHLGAGGPYTAWIQGRSVGQGSAYRSPHPLQDTHAVELSPGWNRVLIKVSALDRMWGFYARLSRPDGSPIAGLKATAEPPERWKEPSRDAAGTPPKIRVESLRAALEGRYTLVDGKGKGRPAAGLDLVTFYRHTRPFDFDEGLPTTLAREVDQRLQSSRSAWLLAILERDPNEGLVALRDGIARAREEDTPRSRALLAQMLLELAWRQRSVGLQDRYEELLDEAFDVAPWDALVELQLIDRMSESGYAWSALTWLRHLAQRNPESETLQAELASRLRRQGRTSEALKVLEALAAHRGGDSAVLASRIEVLLDLGRGDEAAELARRAARTSPGLPGVHVTVAKLEEARGRTDAAIAAWARAIALAPADAELHADLGRLAARTGDITAATASLRRSLELLPQQPAIRDLLASLEDAGGADLFARWSLDLDEIGKTKTPPRWKGKHAGILHHRVAVKVLPNGLTERLDHRIVRIVDDRGIRSQAIQALSYDPAESIVEVRRARVRRANGRIEELGDVQVVALASAGYRMYYDQRQVRVVFGGLRVGDTIEVAFLKRDVAARNMFEDYFGDLVPVQGTEPRLKMEYVLEAPADKPIYFNRQDVTRKTSKNGKSVTYRYAERDVEAIKPESGMPGWIEVAKYLHASTYRTWDDVGNWYWDLVREQLVVDEDVRAAVRDALSDLPPDASDEVKTRAIYEYVVRNTRYVGLEFGIHGYKPYRTTEVLSRRFGDCKDKASLLKVMLGEAGIDSHLVLVRTRDQGQVPGKPASLAVFNHAITYVPSLDLWLDGTAEWAGPTELPANDQGASVLVVEDGKGARFQSIPISDADANVREIEQRVELRPDGAAAVEHRLQVSGASASGLRYGFQSAEQRDERLARAFGDLYAGVEVTRTDAPGIGDIQRPPQLHAHLKVPKWATGQGDTLRFRVLGHASSHTSSLAAKASREHDLVLDTPSIERYRMRYILPPGHRFARLPEPAVIESPIGRFSLQIEPTAEGAEVRTELRLTDHRIDPSQYGAFREFLRSVDAKLEQSFEVQPAR